MKLLYKILSLASLGSIYLNFLNTFRLAYMDSSLQVLVTINTGGEANLELIALLLTLPGAVLCFKHLLDEWVLS